MKTISFLSVLAASAILGSTGVLAQEPHDHRARHSSSDMSDHRGAENGDVEASVENPLTEIGQGAFAAFAEAVARLEADPNTDWASVDVVALRDHLNDMDRLVRETAVGLPPRKWSFMKYGFGTIGGREHAEQEAQA